MAKPECSKCGALKEGSYKSESWCGKCIGTRRAELRLERRLEKGLPPIGSGRDPKCKKCGELKGPSYQDSPWCGPCKCASEKIRYETKKAIKAAKEGKVVEKRRSGRNPICKCGIVKEHPNDGHCVKCTKEKRHERAQRRKMEPEWMQKERAEKAAIFNSDAERRRKKLCRRETRRLEDKGLLIRKPCEKCGIVETVDPHHVDYNDPWNVIWLCKRHHTDLHDELKKLYKENK